ncbi:tetratricopeptide repeat protein [Phenylobacterium sp. 58.2.17]|uniref:tetratricopeptide repeat protein n=1 Tax=Phenylobacterium sp. 58.2.17 TaxID=2969306 RepID=UPI002263BA03|nr:tetratricopeptide repeat protein [Phenylobacterium sp. 58.2.17]MCX7588810.1 tetratricopeptide repeat protein [Phenylobacterium sp. 58.2.17]
MRRLLVALAPLLLVTACATAPQDVAWTPPADDGMGGSAYGAFLAGQGALNDGAGAEAAAYFERAEIEGGSSDLLRDRAFTAAVLAGDIPKAAALAPDGVDASEATKRLGQLVKAVELMAQGQGKEAQAALSGEAIGFPHRGAAALLAPWAAAMAGDTEGSLVRPEMRGDRVVDYFGQLGQAWLYERARRYDEAETDYKALTGGDAPGDIAVQAYGAFLERRNRRADAVALYDASLALQPNNENLIAARARAAAGKAAPAAPNLRQGAAQVLVAPAATMLAAKQEQLGLAYLRLALRLDPNRDTAWLMVGDIMEAAGDVDGARAAYARPKPGSSDYSAARSKLAWSYQNAKQSDVALKMAQEAASSGDAEAKLTYADLLRANERYDDSAQVLSGLIERSATPDWRLLYMRGVAYERAGHWPQGERDLKAALELRPDEPELLNYLGYTWIDRGERLAEALGMVERAVAANPQSGAMVDSLGWAHYRLGDYKKAVDLLEQAVELEAGDPEINNHLGDAYWRVGRRIEAEYQWRRVLTLDPDPKIKADVESKLASGQGPKGPAAAPRIAGQ